MTLHSFLAGCPHCLVLALEDRQRAVVVRRTRGGGLQWQEEWQGIWGAGESFRSAVAKGNAQDNPGRTAGGIHAANPPTLRAGYYSGLPGGPQKSGGFLNAEWGREDAGARKKRLDWLGRGKGATSQAMWAAATMQKGKTSFSQNSLQKEHSAPDAFRPI